MNKKVRVFSVLKKQVKCRRNTIQLLSNYNKRQIPPHGDSIEYKGVKETITKISSHPTAGPVVHFETEKGDIGACLSHYWWDKKEEAKDDAYERRN